MSRIKSIIASALIISSILGGSNVLAQEKLLISANPNTKIQDLVHVQEGVSFLGKVKGIEKSDEYLYVLIENKDGNQLKGVISEETAFNKNMDIEVGMDIEVIHSKMITHSIPPQSSVYAVNFINVETIDNEIHLADTSMYSGKVLYVDKGEKRNSILVDTKVGEYIFHISKDTKINTKDEIKIGDTVDVYFNGIATMSLPPQSTAIAINVYNKSKLDDNRIYVEDTESTFGTVKKIMENQIIVETLNGEYLGIEVKDATPSNDINPIKVGNFIEVLHKKDDNKALGINVINKVKDDEHKIPLPVDPTNPPIEK